MKHTDIRGAHACMLTHVMRTQVTTEVQAHLQTLRGRLFSHIINVLDTSPRSTPTSSNSNWQRVRERFLSIFTLPRTHAVPGAAPGVHAQMVSLRLCFLLCVQNKNDHACIHTCTTHAHLTNLTMLTHSLQHTRTNTHNTQGASFSAEKDALLAAAGSVVARSRSKAELATLLAQLHEDITQQVMNRLCMIVIIYL